MLCPVKVKGYKGHQHSLLLQEDKHDLKDEQT